MTLCIRWELIFMVIFTCFPGGGLILETLLMLPINRPVQFNIVGNS